MKTTVVVKIDLREPEPAKLREIIAACSEGKIVAFPTETVYGIGGPMHIADMDAKLREIKGRSEAKPFAYHISEWGMLEKLGVKMTSSFRYLVRQFWPGPVTILAQGQSGQKIGIRFPKNKIACALISGCGEPFIGTSANRSGQSSPHTVQQVMGQLDGAIDYLIDGGKTEFANDSTVVDLSPDGPAILRKGAQGHEVEKALEKIKSGKFFKKKILIVCTGNSCRSPMAEGWLKKELDRRGLSEQIEVASCGMGARDGLPPSGEAEWVMKNREVDISGHRSRTCRLEDIWGADLILAMGEQHAVALSSMLESAKNKTIILNIPDPIGLGVSIYENTIQAIQSKLREHWSEIVKFA